MSDGEPVGGDEQAPFAPAPEPLDEQDLEILAAVGLDASDASDLVRKVLRRLSPRMKRWVLWSVDNWPGRVAFRLANDLRHLQIFDRAMTIAAQMFTSVFPIIIMGASFFGGRAVEQTVDDTGLPPDVATVVNEAVNPSGGWGTFGLIGVLVVLISATSLSRALTRAYDTIWRHGPTRLPPRAAWRWLAAVTALALVVVATHRLVDLVQRVPPPHLWEPVALIATTTAIACYIPWMLMAGRVPVRLLLPGALLFGVIFALTRPVAQRYLTTSIAVSAERFGAIGIAFTSLTYLYCVSWVILAAAVLGRVVVVDSGTLGRLIRGELTLEEEPEPRPGGAPRRTSRAQRRIIDARSDAAPAAKEAPDVSENASPQTQRRSWTGLLAARKVTAVVLVAAALLLVVQNAGTGDVRFLFFDIEAPTWLWLLGVFLAGFASALLFVRRRSRDSAE